MSSLIAVWIDSSQAKLFKFGPDGVQTTHIKPHGPIHHVETQGITHTKAEGDTEKFYHQVAEQLEKDADSKWFILGSGLGHTHFAHHIKKHHKHFAKNILGSRAVDHQTDPQIIAEAKQFFVESGLIN